MPPPNVCGSIAQCTRGAVVVVPPGRRKGGGSIVCAYRPVRLTHTQFAPVCVRVCVCACGDAWRLDRSSGVGRPSDGKSQELGLSTWRLFLRSIALYYGLYIYIYIYMASRTSAYDAKYALCQMSTSRAPPAAGAVKHTRGQRCL
jgi:hypothetical protein